MFLPWAPIQNLDDNPAVRDAAAEYGVTAHQVVLAWLLARSPSILPIPGTGSTGHLEENVAAAELKLTAREVAAISGLG